jgi:hypothetical protein
VNLKRVFSVDLQVPTIEVREDDSDRREIIWADTADARMRIVIEEYSDRGSIETATPEHILKIHEWR